MCSGSNHDVVQRIICQVCTKLGSEGERGGARDGGSGVTVKPPPLLEEELALTASRVMCRHY